MGCQLGSLEKELEKIQDVVLLCVFKNALRVGLYGAMSGWYVVCDKDKESDYLESIT